MNAVAFSHKKTFNRSGLCFQFLDVLRLQQRVIRFTEANQEGEPANTEIIAVNHTRAQSIGEKNVIFVLRRGQFADMGRNFDGAASCGNCFH